MFSPAISSPFIADWKGRQVDKARNPTVKLQVMLTIRPGPSPRTVTRTVLKPRSIALVLMLIAVACAAMFVPLRVFLKPSMPHERINCGTPLASVIEMMVLFGDTRMWQIGISLNGTPLIREVDFSTKTESKNGPKF
uniref:Uncharacterized protein n=1 Tax=Anopheles merus TaxID=30066 RepID=A0A182V531_ANOME